MIRQTVSCLFVSIVLLVNSSAVSGKADTARVTITGGGLASPIQITDTKVLEVSQAWSEEFLDTSRPPLAGAPPLDGAYEVTLYSRIADNDVRKTCVFFYAPSSSEGAQGIIFLPRKGALWTLNSGTIVREGRDGKWSYASLEWEARVKPFIAKAVAERAPTAPFTSEIVVDHWRKPLPGWLYVLDPRSDPTTPGSRIWLVDSEKSNIRGSIRAGYDPDFALSPDGSHLYIASGERESGELAVVDTETGNIRHIPFPDRDLYKPWYQGLPPFSEMALTPDGGALWISGWHVFSPNRIGTQLSVFDIHGEKFLNTKVDVGNCDYGDFTGAPATNHVEFLCGSFANNTVRLLRLDAGGEVSSSSAELPTSTGCGLAEAFPLAGGTKMAIVRTDGAVYEWDLTTQELSPTSATGACCEWTVAPAEWPRSSGGARLFLGYGGIAPDGMSAARELRVFDTATWVELGHIVTSVPFWSAVASLDGKFIYATSPERHGVVVLNAKSLEEKRIVTVGNSPSVAIVAR